MTTRKSAWLSRFDGSAKLRSAGWIATPRPWHCSSMRRVWRFPALQLLLLLCLAASSPPAARSSLGGPGATAGLRGSLAGPGTLPGHGRTGPSRELDHLECRKCGEDLFDFVQTTLEPPAAAAPKKPFGLLRPTGLGAAPKGLPPPRHGDASSASSQKAPLVGGAEIALESGVTTGPTDPTALGYAGPHKDPSRKTILGRTMQIHHLKNPSGREFEVATVTELTNYKTHGPKVAEHSWFPGYSWQIIVCAHCGHHIGWRFDKLPPPVPPVQSVWAGEDAADHFFGILPSEALIESSALKSKLVTHGDL